MGTEDKSYQEWFLQAEYDLETAEAKYIQKQKHLKLFKRQKIYFYG